MLCNLCIIEPKAALFSSTRPNFFKDGFTPIPSIHILVCACCCTKSKLIYCCSLMMKPKWESKTWNDSCTNSQWWCWNVVKSSWCCRVESIKFSSQQFHDFGQVSSYKTFSRASQLYLRFKWNIHFWSCFGVSKVEIIMFQATITASRSTIGVSVSSAMK